jgi:outer membrane protein assembly factor BamB
VFFLYGNGALFGFDFEGKELWSHSIEKEYGNLALQYGYSNSPVLYDGKLYITVIRRDRPYRDPPAAGPLDSFILALDPATGKTLWKQPRKTNAFDEGMETYSTLMPFAREGKVELLMTGGDFITAHDPATGKELWRFEHWQEKVRDSRVIPSLVTGEGLIFGSRHKHNPVFALEPPAVWRGRPALASRDHLGLASPDGDTPDKTKERGQDALATGRQGQDALATGRVLWEFGAAAPDCSTPLFYDGRLYVFDGLKRKVVTCLDPKTGQTIWQGKLNARSQWWSSPTAADGKIYIISENGEIVVLQAGGTEFKVLSEMQIREPVIQSSIPIAGGHLFVRTAANLYCIGK